jgi:hypothetical protein
MLALTLKKFILRLNVVRVSVGAEVSALKCRATIKKQKEVECRHQISYLFIIVKKMIQHCGQKLV